MNALKIGKFAFLAMPILLGPPSFAHQGHHHDQELEAAAPATDSLFNLSSQWTDQNGEKMHLNKLKGKPSLVAMIYTSCESACPLIVADMKEIENQIPENQRAKVNLVLFSFDSERDTTAQLKKYSKARGLGTEWTLARGPSKNVRELAAALGVQYKRSADGDFQHSNLITLLDREGVIQKQQSGLGNKGDDMAKAVMKLINRAD